MMSTLDDLFPDGARLRETEQAAESRAAHRLDEMFGDHRADLEATRLASDKPSLVAMVNAAVADAKPLQPAPTKVSSRKPRRVDLLNVSVGALAVLALAVTGVVGGVHAATASPADDAMRVLTADEKTIESATTALESARTRLTKQVAADDKAAESLRATLEANRSAPDPAELYEWQSEIPEDVGMITIGDTAATDAVLKAIDTYRADLSAFELPAAPADYARKKFYEDDLSSVGAAIDAAQLQLSTIDRASAEVRTVRTELEGRRAAFTAALGTFTASFTGDAQRVAERYPDTRAEFRDDVTSAAAALASADLLTEQGVTALTGYRDAVLALATEQVRLERLWEQERQEREADERERQRRQNQNNNDSNDSNNTDDPPTDPPTDDPPTDPPTDDPPTDPPTDNPEPPVGNEPGEA